MTFTVPNAVQLRVALTEIEPPIWRRLVVPWTFHLGQLHLVLQAAFGWWNSHLHEFRIGGLFYGDPEQVGVPEFEGDLRHFDETEVRLLDFDRGERVSFTYVYDFGDNWAHTVTVEEIRSGGPDNMSTILDDRGARHPKMAAARPDTGPCSTCWPTRPARTTTPRSNGSAPISTPLDSGNAGQGSPA